MTKIQLRRDTLANFTSVNPVLAEGEMAYETDTKKFKIGDGTTAYTNLDYQAHIVYLTRAEYDALETKDATTLYIITDEEGGGGSGSGTTITKGDTTYTTLALGDNLVVTDGVVNVNLDEIGSEMSNLSSRVTAIENAGYITVNEVPLKSVSQPLRVNNSTGDVTLGYDDNFELDSSNQLSLNSTKFSKLSSPLLDVPVNNCVLAMPTVPTFDGTNVTVYAGTKIAIPNGRESGSKIPKVNIVTLSANVTINQSTYNGSVTLMLKSDGTIDQTAYPYNIVDDIDKVTPTAYNWYYCRYSNRHYLASSTGTLTPYQRFKIGEYNLAEGATKKYFKVRFPIGFPPDNEFIDVTPVS